MSGMRGAPGMYRVLHATLPRLVRGWLTVDIGGIENVPRHGPVILACNHLSFLDSILLPLFLPRPVYFLGKAEYFASWRTRWFVEGTGVVAVHRTGGDRSRDSLDTGVAILRQGGALGIYPEGTRSPDGRLYRGKTGPVRMAFEAGAPIVPCAVFGTRDVMPEGSRVPRRGTVRVVYGEPLDLAHHTGHIDDPYVLRAATDELMYEIMRLSGQAYVDAYASSVKHRDAPGHGSDSPAAERGNDAAPGLDGGASDERGNDGLAAS